MAMLAAAAIAAGMWPPRNRRAVNKQRYCCTSTEDLCLSVRVSKHKVIASWRSSSVSGDDGNESRQVWYYF